MIKSLVIIGSGALAAEISSHIISINSYGIDNIMVKGYIDDDPNKFKINTIKYKYNEPYLGTLSQYCFNLNEEYIIGIGNINSRKMIIEILSKYKLNFTNLIHPNAQIDKNIILGNGNIIYSNTIIGPNVIIGDHNVITSFSFISHDCIIGNNNFFSTTGLAGSVTIGCNNFFGIRATVIPEIKIGDFNTLQAGMIIDKDIKDNETVYYRFKEKVSFIKTSP